MVHKLLQKVRIRETAEEYSDIHGEIGIVISMRQSPIDPLPYISLEMSNGEVVEDLLPGDLEVCPE